VAPKVTVADFFGLDAVKFADIPGTKQEVVSAGSIIRGPKQLLLEADATEAAFKTLPLSEFRIIHLAAHGVASAEFPDRAALVLGSSPASADDGLLQVREIRDLRLRAELVTLSACDTGMGRLLGQEGIASLERAFLLAGAKSVIAGLWPADDTFTVAFMNRLYQHESNGADKGMALRQAKLDVLKEFGNQALPVYWAGFTLVGDGSAAIFK
jgi:CHAT domain-containing protein